ncbi:MAG: hypothetical protein LQ347_003126 [Umbilicaria vellea]|nr:MAG: hypothetical protein LQ347_003126 [Umbilicaria vellea]
MATLAFKPYTYKPTAPRSKSTATHRRPAPEQVSILNKLQHITLSGASLSTPRPAADDGGYRPGIRAQGFTTGDRGPDKTSGVEEVAADERGGSVNQSRSAQSDNSGGGPNDPIVLLGDGNLSASEAEANDLVDHALDTLLIDEGARKQQEVEQEQEKDKGNTEDEDERPQQEMNVVAPVVTAERASGSPRLANRRQSLPNLDSSPEPSYNEAGSRSGGDSDDELNSTDLAEDDEKKPRPAKRKQLSSSHDGPTRKKHRYHVPSALRTLLLLHGDDPGRL